jgi:hypothetical protein
MRKTGSTFPHDASIEETEHWMCPKVQDHFGADSSACNAEIFGADSSARNAEIFSRSPYAWNVRVLDFRSETGATVDQPANRDLGNPYTYALAAFDRVDPAVLRGQAARGHRPD